MLASKGRGTNAVTAGSRGRNRVKRLSKVMKGREVGKKGGVDILVDSASGRRYSYDKKTGATAWIVEQEEQEEQEEEEIVVQDEQVGEGVEEDEVYCDPVSGRNYSIDETTGTSYWR